MSTALGASASSRADLRFDGRVAVVTGAGGGLGRAYALALAARGARVIVNDVGGSVSGQGADSRAADRVVDEIRAAGGFAAPDYNSVEAGTRIVANAVKTFGRIDILICNAGILRDVSFTKMDDAAWESVMGVHLRGSFACAHAAWPHMREQGYGRIVFVASSSGIYGNFGQSNYAAAKMGIVGLANTLAREGAKRGILVNTIAPIAASRMTESVMPPDLLAALKPEAVAPAVVYLCHESCSTTGMLYEVGGGWIARLRWQRSRGAFLPTSAHFKAEDVRDLWQKVDDFSAGASFPDSTQSAFEPIMANLRATEGGDASGTSLDDPAAAAAARAVAAGEADTRGITEIPDMTVADALIKALPGGKSGTSDAVDVPGTLAHRFKPIVHTYTERDTALYALSIGVSQNPLDSNDLRYCYELHPSGMRVVPTFAVLFPHSIMADLTTMPTMKFNPMMLLHGEQELVLPRGIVPPAATVVTRGKVTNVYDKGSGAVVVFTAVTTEKDSGTVVAVNRSSIFIRGIGGFGGDRGPAAPSWSLPSRVADVAITQSTNENQALWYRLNGDTNPLHADPDMASMGGFQRPILHGLCTFGIAGRALLKSFAEDDPSNFRAIKARFVKHVFPGETLVVEAWKMGHAGPTASASGETVNLVYFQCKVAERNEIVLSNGVAEIVQPSPRPRL